MHAALLGMSLTYTLPPLVVPRVSLLVNNIMLGIIITIAIRKLQLAYIYNWLILLLFVCSTISVFGCLQ